MSVGTYRSPFTRSPFRVSFAASRGSDIRYSSSTETSSRETPDQGLPHEVITDKGTEFFGPRMQELCRKYGVEIQSLPPFRPDGKGLVEKSFDLIQQRYKPLLQGKGVIEPDAQERWSTDYRSQSVLNLDEFIKIVIHCVLYINSGRSGCSPRWRRPPVSWLYYAVFAHAVSEHWPPVEIGRCTGTGEGTTRRA